MQIGTIYKVLVFLSFISSNLTLNYSGDYVSDENLQSIINQLMISNPGYVLFSYLSLSFLFPRSPYLFSPFIFLFSPFIFLFSFLLFSFCPPSLISHSHSLSSSFFHFYCHTCLFLSEFNFASYFFLRLILTFFSPKGNPPAAPYHVQQLDEISIDRSNRGNKKLHYFFSPFVCFPLFDFFLSCLLFFLSLFSLFSFLVFSFSFKLPLFILIYQIRLENAQFVMMSLKLDRKLFASLANIISIMVCPLFSLHSFRASRVFEPLDFSNLSLFRTPHFFRPVTCTKYFFRVHSSVAEYGMHRFSFLPSFLIFMYPFLFFSSFLSPFLFLLCISPFFLLSPFFSFCIFSF